MKNLILTAVFSLLCLTVNTQLNAQSHSSTTNKVERTSISFSGSFSIDTDHVTDWLDGMLVELEADGIIPSTDRVKIKFEDEELKVNSQILEGATYDKYMEILMDHFIELNSLYVNLKPNSLTISAKN